MDDLAAVPGRFDRVESQVLQLRNDMTMEFSTVRDETRVSWSAAVLCPAVIHPAAASCVEGSHYERRLRGAESP